MKTILLTITLICFSAVCAIAAPNVKQVVPFSQYSAASGTAVKTAAIKALGFKYKSVQVNGYSMGPKAEAALAGTALIECAPTSNGPWVTCAQEDGTAISTTSNSIYQWSDTAAFIRASWAKTTGRVSVWLNLSE